MSGIERVLHVGAEGGSVTLIGRRLAPGAWQFARIMEDQTEALLGDRNVDLPEPPSVETLEWVEGWDAGLRLMDRYRWVMLQPVAVHPELRERVAAAVEERLALEGLPEQVERVRRRWARTLEAATS